MSDDDRQGPDEPVSWKQTGRHFAFWCLVCWIAAAPSFYLGAMIGEMGALQLAAMAAGVFVFAGAYTEVSTSAWFRRLRKRPFVDRTLKIGYGLRLAQSFLSLVPPIAFADAFVGIASVWTTIWLLGGEPVGDLGEPSAWNFLIFLIATLVQGCLLNVILVVLMLVIYGLQRAFAKPPPDPRAVCAKCGYDLRASKEVCPECGEAIPAAAPPPEDSLIKQLNRL